MPEHCIAQSVTGKIFPVQSLMRLIRFSIPLVIGKFVEESRVV
jgi:hypothetical protein